MIDNMFDTEYPIHK